MTEERKITVEEVDTVEKPAKARVAAPSPFEAEAMTEKLERKKDYLEGFLAKKPEDDESKDVATSKGSAELRDDIIAAIKEIYDPEIPVNIYDLGLIYGVEVNDNAEATVMMTLTTPHCPVAESMPGEVELRVGAVPGVGHAEVNLIWDPPWSPENMTDEARLELGML